MSDRIWLASYPKSGNTWTRMLLSALGRKGAVDINDASLGAGIASARMPFDNQLLVESGLLDHDEVDVLRPRLYEIQARDIVADVEGPDDADLGLPVRFPKVHDAYTLTDLGEPMLAGARGAKGAIVIVRDPRAVAPSLANHMETSMDQAIAFMANPKATLSGGEGRLANQLRQKLLSWSDHAASWLDQTDIPVLRLRYEDMSADTAGALASVLAFTGIEAERSRIEEAVAAASFERLKEQEHSKGFAEWRGRAGNERRFFRRGESGGWREELTADQIAQIERDHHAMMARLGYALSES